MIDLLLDSSNVDLSVGLAKDNKVIDFISYEAWQCQSEYMIQEIDKLLTKYNVPFIFLEFTFLLPHLFCLDFNFDNFLL